MALIPSFLPKDVWQKIGDGDLDALRGAVSGDDDPSVNVTDQKSQPEINYKPNKG